MLTDAISKRKRVVMRLYAGSDRIDLEHCVPFGDDLLRDAEGTSDPSRVPDAASSYGGWFAAEQDSEQ